MFGFALAARPDRNRFRSRLSAYNCRPRPIADDTEPHHPESSAGPGDCRSWCRHGPIAGSPAPAGHSVPDADARRRRERDRGRRGHQQGWPPRHRVRRELVRSAPGVDEAPVPRARLLGQLHRQLQRPAGRRRRRRLSDIASRDLVREEDLLVPEPGQGAGALGRGADQCRLQYRVRDPCRPRQRRQGAGDRGAGERHRAVVVRSQCRGSELGAGGSAAGSAGSGLQLLAPGSSTSSATELRPRHRRRRRQQGRPQRHPDAARLARSAGGSAGRGQLDVPRRHGSR